jgi:leucyl-tRNA synthetase
MQGYNVLFPQGFHATGEPILGVVERLKKNDEIQINTLKSFGAKEPDLKRFLKDPKNLVEFFMNRWINDLKLAGMSIDWRRTFVTTTITPTYSRFIEWQYNTLKKKGYVVQGTHPVIWCPKCQSPTGDHDRLKGEGESPIDYIMIKFGLDDLVLPCATLRPETIYGVTNVWIHPDAAYVKINVNGQKWVVSKRCFEKLKDQINGIEFIENIDPQTLIGKSCTTPLTEKNVPLFPAKFVDPENATGIVMSVPAHAPYDLIALKELIDTDLEKYGIEKNDLEPTSIIETPGFGEIPAKDICESMNITSIKQEKELDKATNILYKKEFHTGVLKDNCGEYAGMKVSDCKEKLSIEFIEKNIADIMWECPEVVCRCTTTCHVKILENQWFLKYSDEDWKKLARRCLSKMNIYPDEARNNMNVTIDWLRNKACTRKTGFGTPLPWDKEWIVETLSDSTIYMAYYTLSRIIKKNKIPEKKLTDNVFDFIFLNKGDIKKISKESGLDKKLMMDMKKEFEYFYPIDLRTSGKDLLQHHLIFFLFHHAAIFPEKFWPRGIGVNGYVNIESEKMSKSKGNITSLRDCLETYGTDMTRINMVCSSEGIDDSNWTIESIKGYRSRYEFLFEVARYLKKAKSKEIRNIDLYLQSRIQKNIQRAGEAYESMNFRTASHYAVFDSINELKWYMKRVGDIKNANKRIVTEAMKNIILMLSPLTPHLCEELWHMLGNKKMLIIQKWPIYNVNFINEEAELSEEIIKQTLTDVEEIKKITKIEPRKVTVFVAENWKFRVYQTVLRNKERSINDITNEIMNSDMNIYGKATIMFIQNLYKKINELKPVLPRTRQFNILNESSEFLKKELGTRIEITDAEKTGNAKSKSATPQRFGILLE